MVEKTEISLKAIEQAKSLSETIITISTGIITISITFTKDILSNKVKSRSILSSSWLCYFISIIFGIVHIEFLIGLIDANNGLDITAPARVTFTLQLFMFLAGTLLAIIYGRKSLKQLP